MTPSLRRLGLVCALGAIGCAPYFPLPMTAVELVSYDSGPALVAYLGQPDATPAVCDLGTRGPHLSTASDEVRTALVRGLVDGKIDPRLWRRCAANFLRSAPREDSASLVDAVGQGYRKLIREKDFETSPPLQDRLRAMQQLYVERKNGFDGHAAVDDKLVAELGRALLQHRLGPVATSLGEDLVETVDLEHGRWLGHTVDLPAIDALYKSHDEKTLRRFANRLPSSELRDQAKRRVIRLHIAASPFVEVRNSAAAVEETLMRTGINPLSLVEHAPLRGRIDAQKVPMRGVLVRQQVWQQTASLLGYSGDRPGLSVLPEVKLRGALQVEVAGLSQPVTVCGHPSELDPSPCVAVADVRLDNPAAYLDKGGAFHFVEHIAMRDAVNLAQLRDRFVLPVSVAGKRLCAFEWSLYYERPEDMIFSGGAPGSDGPNLGVGVDNRDPARFIFNVASGGERWLAVVEGRDAAAFHVVSRGAQGYGGASGSPGMSGSSRGECQDGGNGGNGGDGGDGGDGGNGGDVAVSVTCAAASCSSAIALLQQTVASEGGAGGPGGSGGTGGPGGSGGSGRAATTHTDSDGNVITDDPGCSAGSSGMSGTNGADGASGAPGRPGHVGITVAR